MFQEIIRISVHFVCFGLSFYCLSGLDLAKLLRKSEVKKAQILLLMLSMALGFLVAQFLLALPYQYQY